MTVNATGSGPSTRPEPADMAQFRRDLSELGASLRAGMGEADLAHYRKMALWGRLCTVVGFALAWIAPNPISVFLLSTGTMARWAMIGHHVGHRGYDKVGGPKGRDFAEGWDRWRWLDWMLPAAWKHEHNKLHHYHLNEERDPDLVEANVAWLREGRLPRWARLVVVSFFAMTWKWTYYAPTTLAELSRREEEQPTDRARITFSPASKLGRAVWWQCLLPYATARFVVVPLLFAPLGWWAAMSVLVNAALAELLTNLHAFAVIVPNHVGDDLYRFREPGDGRAAFFLRQIVGSTNYRTGGDLNDFMHGYLNYQIEHHLWPDLSMLAYQKAQPQVKELCRKHGVPYVQEGVFSRVRKTVAVMVGDASMRVWEDRA